MVYIATSFYTNCEVFSSIFFPCAAPEQSIEVLPSLFQASFILKRSEPFQLVAIYSHPGFKDSLSML